MKSKIIFEIIFFTLLTSIVSAQNLPQDSVKIKYAEYNLQHREINYTSLSLIAASSITTGVVLHNYQYQFWWKNNSSNFTFNNSFNNNKLMNKSGRFYSTNLIAHFYSAGFEGAGINYETATIYSAIIGLGYGLYVETFDGFTKNEGFNLWDFSFNILGAAYVLGQYYIPELKNFQPRFSYYPSKEFSNNELKNKNIFTDYGGQKYWIGIRIKEYLPKSVSEYWPSFLMISAGMGVNNFSENKYSKNEFFVTLDLDAEELPLYGSFWQFIKNTLNYIHFPMPGIRISPNAAAFLFCY